MAAGHSVESAGRYGVGWSCEKQGMSRRKGLPRWKDVGGPEGKRVGTASRSKKGKAEAAEDSTIGGPTLLECSSHELTIFLFYKMLSAHGMISE